MTQHFFFFFPTSLTQSINRTHQMKKINRLILRKCKSLSRQLGRSSSYSILRSKSTREQSWGEINDEDDHETIFVGSTRKPYVISSRYLNHPLLNAIIEKQSGKEGGGGGGGGGILVAKCEVVLFDHLLWMLDNTDPKLISDDSLEELASLYVF